MPKISVIMPVYNEPEIYLRAAINSILKQTFADFEFIIIDDCSGPEIASIIHSYTDNRIRYYRNNENLKIIKTLNRGLELAQGEYVARMDADDISMFKRFEHQVKFLDNNPEIGLVGTFGYSFPGRVNLCPPTAPSDIEVFLNYCANCIIHPSVMFRKSTIDENNLKYSENFLHVEDYKLWLDFCKVSKLSNIQEPLVLHRLHKNSISSKNDIEQYFNSQIMIFGNMLHGLGMNDLGLSLIHI